MFILSLQADPRRIARQEVRMTLGRKLIMAAIAGVMATQALEAVPAHAQVSNARNPWCLRDGPLGRGTWDCSYQTRQQCLISSNYDNDGHCTENPNYRGPARKQRDR
jgi:hypothetical protein